MLAQTDKTRIGHRRDPHIGSHRGEITVGGLAGGRQGIEERGLADFGQTDNSYFHWSISQIIVEGIERTAKGVASYTN